ncbi:MAG: cytochrome c3 family protein [Acidobacteria bacterium]|nr:cytochrome c3 family protein [Acidobacteriota bacterium]
MLAILSLWLLVGAPDCNGQATYQRPAPEQPLPFSHRKHAAQKLACRQCHPMPDPGDFATIPATTVCMACHIAIKKDSPHIVKLTAYHAGGGKVPWARVYRVPDYVFFNHKAHVNAKDMNCGSCHGPVEERDALRREKDIGMQACMECHRSRSVSVACDFCHEPK